jgi:CubicO group peptidase (beta-lactamase class C family)
MARLSRREFVARASCGAISVAIGARTIQAAASSTELDGFIEAEMQAQKIPGLAACIVKSGKIVWSKGYGWSNVKRRVAMDPESTIQNIGSISKTVTATAIMQLREKGKFDLDDDINQYLPFPVRNPSHPDRLISFRSLLTHRSSIADSPAYSSSYACGDPGIDLATWIKAYLTVDGRYYVKEKNFHPWKPGEKYEYSNVGFGLLGFLVERLSGEPFDVFTKRSIFDPLETLTK